MGLKTIGGRDIDMGDTTYIQTAIEEANEGDLKVTGSCLFQDLPELDESQLGNVYNVTDDFITTDDFIEGKGHPYFAGSNVAIVRINDALKYDVIGGNDNNVYATDEEVQEMLSGLYK